MYTDGVLVLLQPSLGVVARNGHGMLWRAVPAVEATIAVYLFPATAVPRA